MSDYESISFRIIAIGKMMEHTFMTGQAPMLVDSHGVIHSPPWLMYHPHSVSAHRTSPEYRNIML